MLNSDEENQSSLSKRIIGEVSGYANKLLTLVRLVKVKFTRSTGMLSVGFDFVSNVIGENNQIDIGAARSSLNFAVSTLINNKLAFPFATYRVILGSTAITKIFLTDATTNNLWAIVPTTKKSATTLPKPPLIDEKFMKEMTQCILSQPLLHKNQHKNKLFDAVKDKKRDGVAVYQKGPKAVI